MASKANILVGWPDSKLSPNYGDRARYQKRRLQREARAAAMEDCRWTVDENWLAFKGQGRLLVTFYPPDRRRRDLDNLFAMIKHAIDGVCEVLGIDDSQLHPVILDFGTVSPDKPYIEVVIEDLENRDPFYGLVPDRTTGTPNGRPKKATDEVLRALVADLLVTNSNASSNEIARQVGGNRNRVLTLVRELKAANG